MSNRDLFEFFSDISESTNRIRDYIDGMTYEDFLGDFKTRDVVLRNLEVIGGASKYVDPAHRVQPPFIINNFQFTINLSPLHIAAAASCFLRINRFPGAGF